MLLDLPADIAKAVRRLGFNLTTGSFGPIYQCSRSAEWLPIPQVKPLHSHKEQEIIFIDLSVEKINPFPGTRRTLEGVNQLFAPAENEYIDPRPLSMLSARDDMDRILDSGGVIVVFAQPRMLQLIKESRTGFHGGPVSSGGERTVSSWAFLSLFEGGYGFDSNSDQGTELEVLSGGGPLPAFLRRHLLKSRSDAHFGDFGQRSQVFRGRLVGSLAKNKYGDTVSFVAVGLPQERTNGLVIVLPQFDDKSAVITDLLRNVLPELAPNLFPHHEGARWIHRPEYEHAEVVHLTKQKEDVRTRAKKELAGLDEQISTVRQRLGFLHGLITKTGDALVADVKTALEFIDFNEVRFPLEESTPGFQKQEDLQIWDDAPRLVLEVKGMSGLPKEDDTLVVTKYVVRRMKEWAPVEAKGVSLINAQRNLPPLERQHSRAFTQAQIGDAESLGFGLLTTWDLFLLIRGMATFGWPSATVRGVFRGQGMLPSVPTHYVEVGTVAHFYTEKSVIRVETNGERFGVGDTIGFRLPDGFYEETVNSLQADKVSLSDVDSPQVVGMPTTLKRSDLPEGISVYRVGPTRA